MALLPEEFPLVLTVFMVMGAWRISRSRVLTRRAEAIGFMDQLQDRLADGRAVLVAALAWSLAWKGASLWRAARNGSKPWFATLLLSNTLGVLDAIYVFGVDRRRVDEALAEREILAETGEPVQSGHPQET